MRSVLFLAIALILTSCTKVDVYALPIPEPTDTKTLIKIRDGLKPEDHKAWVDVMLRKSHPLAKKIEAKTVGEAIEHVKARTECMDQNSKSISIEDAKAYNAQVDAYNACLEMPI